MDTKSDPEIDAWTIRGSTFQVLGRFLRCLIFDECRWQRIDITGGDPPWRFRGGSLLVLSSTIQYIRHSIYVRHIYQEYISEK